MLAKETKPGAIVVFNQSPCLIESVNVQSPSARGAATLYKYRARNLITKQKVDITLKGTESLDLADFFRRTVKYLYADPTHVHFMDNENYEQYDLAREDVQQEMLYLTEDLEGIQALFYNDQPVSLQLPVAVELTVTQCDPAIRGNSATARTKPATLETGLVVQVPEYLNQGERIKVDTRTGLFLQRA
jgi:elongation factor P